MELMQNELPLTAINPLNVFFVEYVEQIVVSTLLQSTTTNHELGLCRIVI